MPDPNVLREELALRLVREAFAAKEAARASGGAFTAAAMTILFREILSGYRLSMPRPKRAPKAPDDLSDAAWIASLEARPAYAGIDVRREIDRCRLWCETKKRRLSRQRVINWLNKSDPTCSPGARRGAAAVDFYREPEDWRSTLRRISVRLSWADETLLRLLGERWADLPLTVRDLILREPR
jgi:hypothetical protein